MRLQTLLDEANGQLDGMHRTCVDLFASLAEAKAQTTSGIANLPGAPPKPRHIRRPPAAAPPPALAALLKDGASLAA